MLILHSKLVLEDSHDVLNFSADDEINQALQLKYSIQH